MKKILITIFAIFVITYPQQILAAERTGADPAAPVTINNPIGSNDMTPQQFIGRIIRALLGIVGSLALLMFIYGGFTWMTSQGSADKITKGKNIVIWAIIGMAIIFTSYTLVDFIITRVTQER